MTRVGDLAGRFLVLVLSGLACSAVFQVASTLTDEQWDQIATWAVLWAAPAQALFALLYLFGSQWWRSPIGRALMMKSGSLAVVLAIIFAVYQFHVTIPRPVAACAYVFVFVGVVWQLIAFARIRFSVEGRAEHGGLAVMAWRWLRSRVP